MVLTYSYIVSIESALKNRLEIREPDGTLNVIVVVKFGSSAGSANLNLIASISANLTYSLASSSLTSSASALAFTSYSAFTF